MQRRTDTVDLALFGTEALGAAAPVKARPAEPFTPPAPTPSAPTTSSVEQERIDRQCAELARLVNTPTDDYQGLRAGDRISIHWPTNRYLDTAVVQSTCEWGALVAPEPGGPHNIAPCKAMYVRRQLDYGPFAGAWTR